MHQVVGVRFKKAGKIYYFSPGSFQLEKGETVIVETSRGVEFGRVVIGTKTVGENDVVLPLKQVIRIATEKDKLVVKENTEQAKKAFEVCTEKIIEHKLDMKLVDVEYTFDRNKVLFYFTADGRIDFRELVKDLAAVFRTRIELRQIGVRDEAKMLGGIGPCGRVLCCSSFLGDFEPVSIKMAKDQSLSLNPAKISGLCGRLMCCLKYENDMYESAKKELPDVGKRVKTPEGKGKVIGLNLLERVIQVELVEGERIVEFTMDELMSKEGVPTEATE
ncbi:stage 0 sporulation family protein [Alkalihalobacillus sp. MEB130]|uniref:PSP1 domain-containing protein n=1 Tax=Alkalihalobacillus sp. MEB130 TaxID=2976704 RepID=UPI0028DD4385|nr:stage 0 sporulation family protein [Alkalihalobacillus sp. MEB130]MDT8862625.1 stage 0 sporulation family protein [Alkalihalobacillus sp. MEB130]